MDPRSRTLLALVGLAAVVSPAALPLVHAGLATDQVPCSSVVLGEDTGLPGLCADLIIDEAKMRGSIQVQTRSFGSTSCDVLEGHVTPGTHKLLRWTYNTPNIGTSDLVVGRPSDHPEWFYYAPCHRHYHFHEYADYRLWTPEKFASYLALRTANPDKTFLDLKASHPDIAGGYLEGNKGGFCVIDLTPIPGLIYGSCNNQGISVGSADEYHHSLSGQWIVIDNVPPGQYILENEVNAERAFQELNYANNLWAVPITL